MKKDRSRLRERYLRDKIPVRLGGIAANLGRIRSFSSKDSNRDVVLGLIEESKLFIEWTASEASIEIGSELVELQIQLALWQLKWTEIWHSPPQRVTITEQSRAWSDRLLAMSGLLTE